MSVKIGLNGFGRIGRIVLRMLRDSEDLEVVAINARANTETLAHLFKYDSCYGIFNGEVCAKGENVMSVNGKDIHITRAASPAEIPWAEFGVDIVIESTGKFKDRESCEAHMAAGAKKVIIPAPGKKEDVTIVMGVNEEDYDPAKHNIISNASCTTNCLAPFAKVLSKEFGIEKGLMTTVHAYTNDQRILDKSHKDLRRARAAAESIIPTTTGAAKAVSRVLPELEGKLNGFALRVPTPTVSLVDLTCELGKSTSVEEINAAFKNASETYMKGILGYSELPLVSVDYRGDERSSIVDGLSTMAMGDRLFKVVAWYDNEWGYSARTVDLARYVADRL